MEELIKSINKITDFRVELLYYSDDIKEGYKAGFYGDEDYQMREVFDNPIEAIIRLAKDHELVEMR